jgi:hypothetical protein
LTPVDDAAAKELKVLRARAAISKIVELERDEREGFSVPWNLVGVVGIAVAACFGLYLVGSLLTDAIRGLPL